MKAQKIFTLDVELIQQLQKEQNASALVNKLVLNHYNSFERKIEKMTPEQLEKELKIAEIQAKAQKEIEAINAIS